jgi:hypothetical protein
VLPRVQGDGRGHRLGTSGEVYDVNRVEVGSPCRTGVQPWAPRWSIGWRPRTWGRTGSAPCAWPMQRLRRALVTVEGSAVAHELAEAERVHGGVAEDALAAGGRGDVRAGAPGADCVLLRVLGQQPAQVQLDGGLVRSVLEEGRCRTRGRRPWELRRRRRPGRAFPWGGLHICGVDTAKYLPTQMIYLLQQILQRQILPLMSFCHH